MPSVHKRAGRGFALVTVLVIMLAGMALLGAAFYLHGSFTHRAIRSMGDVDIDNYMDEGIEFGTTELMLRLNEHRNFLKRNTGQPIEKPEHLVVIDRTGNPMSYRTNGITAADGKKYDLLVEVLDLDYDPTAITDNEVRAKLPPSVGSGALYKTYLIRSTMFKTPPESGGTVTETAVTVNKEWIASDDVTSGEVGGS